MLSATFKYAKNGGEELTAIFSNMSVVSMPKEYEKYIYCFDVYASIGEQLDMYHNIYADGNKSAKIKSEGLYNLFSIDYFSKGKGNAGNT